MENSSVRRRHRSPSEWAEIVEQSKSAQQPLRAFCASKGVAVSAFYHWRSKLTVAGKQDSIGFTPVRLRQVTMPDVAPCVIEVRLQNGRSVRVMGTQVNRTMLRDVIAAAEGGASC